MTSLGGDANEDAYAIVIADGGDAYVTGFANSGDFIRHQNVRVGLDDAFLAKVSSSGAPMWMRCSGTLQWMNDFGGSGSDFFGDAAGDAAGNTWIAGSTDSTDFERRINDHFGGVRDAFVVTMTSEHEPRWAVYLGGTGDEGASGIALETTG